MNYYRNSIEEVWAELWRDGKGWILVTVGLGWLLSYGVRLVYPALIPFFRVEFQINLALAGLILSLLWGAYAIGQLPGGILGDRIGEGTILVISTAVSSIMILVVSVSVTITMLMFATVGFGLATALYGPTRFTIFTNIYEDRAGSAIGITMAAGSAGSAILPVIATVIAIHLSWRLSFGILLPLFIGVTAALWVTVPRRTSGKTSAVDKFTIQTLKQIAAGIRRGSIPVIVMIQVCMSFVYQGFVSFYPIFLIDIKTLSPSVASSLFGLFFVASFVVQPVSGYGMDQLGEKWMLMIVLCITMASLWMLPFIYGLGPLIVLTVLLGSLSGYSVVTQTYIADALPKDMKGTGLGTLRTGWMILGATSPIVIGFLGNIGYFNEAFFMLAGIATVGLSLTILRL